MTERKKLIRTGDVVLSVALILVAIAVTLLTATRDPGARAVIRVNGSVVAILNLDQQETVGVEGDLGVTVVEVIDGGVHIISSPCPNHTCMKMGFVRMKGQMLVCVPNRVVVVVEGGEQEGVDGIVG